MNTTIKIFSCAIALIISLLYVSSATFAQDEYIPIPDVAGDPDLQTAQKVTPPFTIRFGGWVTPTVVDMRTSGTDLMSSVTTARLWFSSSLWANASLYVRIKDSYLYVLNEKNMNIDDKNNVFDLDIASLTIPVYKKNIRLVLGRKYYVAGSGLVLNGRGDGAELQIYSKFGDIKSFGMYSGWLAKDDNPYGLSSRDIADGSRRIFASATYSKDFLGNNTLYIFGVMQKDKGKEPVNIKTKYNSNYVGGGLKGVVGDFLTYNAEYVYEQGNSYAQKNTTTGTQAKSSIKAQAVLAMLRYYMHNVAFKPMINVMYGWGTGDKDATSYNTNPGNELKGDNRFMYFGTFLGGFALRPQLGNMHVIRPGFGFSPFDRLHPRIKDINLIVYYSYYAKDKKESPINGGEATLAKRFVGQAIDTMLRWPVYCDFSIFANYGLFLPGDAYTSNEPKRHFIMAGVNIVF